jgi:hypothetical protein
MSECKTRKHVWFGGIHPVFLSARGMPIARPPEDTVYHLREFEVQDINGYGLCFGQDISGMAAEPVAGGG